MRSLEVAAPDDSTVPRFETIALARNGRLLTITLNRPDTLNAVDDKMHDDLVDVFAFATEDQHSDVIVLTGAGRGFSAGGDFAHLADMAAHPEVFDRDATRAKRIVFSILDLEKPLVCRLNGHATGLGATLALLCDVVFAADSAKIGDPHVAIGLVAGDGGALVWPERVGLAIAKEYLMTGDLVPARKAADLGLINHCLPSTELDGAVEAFCRRLLSGSTNAIRWTKVLLNLELKRKAHALMDPGIAYEAVSVRSADFKNAVEALRDKKTPTFRNAERDQRK
jgi:enoyl-CoA hydratase